MSIATVKAVINGQTYPLTLAEDGYYTLSGTAPALSSANEPGGYYGVQIIATDEAGNETTINQEAGHGCGHNILGAGARSEERRVGKECRL